jgi:hypothetical protein
VANKTPPRLSVCGAQHECANAGSHFLFRRSSEDPSRLEGKMLDERIKLGRHQEWSHQKAVRWIKASSYTPIYRSHGARESHPRSGRGPARTPLGSEGRNATTDRQRRLRRSTT